MDVYDTAIVGAGFGGLSAALELSRRGKSVVVFERLTYPGGCASTFRRRGYAFESGATLFSGFGEGQLFDRLVRQYDLDVEFVPLDPVVEMRVGDVDFDVSSNRETFVEQMCARAKRPDAVRRFLDYQKKVADVLWSVLDDPDLLPPLSWSALGTHLKNGLEYAKLIRWIGRPLTDVLRAFEVDDEPFLRNYLDAVCQITVQAPASSAEALFALGATDYFFRGTGHIHGGVGELATALAQTVEAQGGEVRFADEVRGLRREGDHWLVKTRRGEVRAKHVIANLLPGVVDGMVEVDAPRLEKLDQRVIGGWGAAMLYLSLEDRAEMPDGPFHLQLVADDDQPFMHGNHVFVSVCGRDEIALRSKDGTRTATVSTHFDLRRFRELADDVKPQFVDGVHDRMRATIQLRAPGTWDAVAYEMTASPRTWERFTARPSGIVGGVPRDASLTHYLGLSPRQYAPNLWLVGDSVFPGQSVLATSVGGMCVARAVASA